MATPILPGSLESATTADLRAAERYVGPVTWVGDPGDGEAIKFVFERVDGTFETFTVGDLKRCTWWRLGNPEHVLAIEAFVHALPPAGEAQIERRKDAIRAEQASARARLAVA